MFRRALTAARPRLLPAPPRSLPRIPPATSRSPVASVSLAVTNQPRSFSTTARATCPQCSAPLPTALPVCTNCFHISSIPPEMSLHEMFDAPYEPNPFVIDPVALKRRFRDLQSIIHPDRWVGRTSEQQEVAAVMSARINDALHRLSSPLRRVEYILEREGFSGTETDKLEDPVLLMEILEMREQVESAESRDAVEQVRAENAERLEETIHEIERLVGEKDWAAVKTAAVRLKYLQGIEQAAAAWPNPFTDHH